MANSNDSRWQPREWQIAALGDEWYRIAPNAFERYRGEEQITVHGVAMQSGEWSIALVYEIVDSPIRVRSFRASAQSLEESIDEEVTQMLEAR